ncbi:MAG: uroporphyrinogen decarboxylase family protein [Gemmatimonadales bacterium]
MTERERFQRLMRGEVVDRPPLLEEGVRRTVVRRWHKQGLPQDKTHLEVFGLTPHENVGPNLRCKSCYYGRIMNLSPREYRRAFDTSRRRFPTTWKTDVKRLEQREHVACIWASRGFFQALGVGDWQTLEQALVGTIKQRQRICDFMEIYGDFCARMLDMSLQEVDPEFVYLSEPISGNDGPLISPIAFREFMIPAYDKIIAAAKNNGCDRILVSTYGNTRSLFPAMIEAGVTMLWISEAAELPELDYRTLRREYGSELGLIGGIPLSILRTGSSNEIRNQLRQLITPLLESGRYVPLASGRIREEIPWQVYKRYREVLAEAIGWQLS